MTTKKELEEEIKRINTRVYAFEVKTYAEKQRLTERIVNQENTINTLARMLESSGITVRLTDDNGLRLIE